MYERDMIENLRPGDRIGWHNIERGEDEVFEVTGEPQLWALGPRRYEYRVPTTGPTITGRVMSPIWRVV